MQFVPMFNTVNVNGLPNTGRRMNCDVVATWLTTGNLHWSTKTCLCEKISKIKCIHLRYPPAPKVHLKRKDLLEIEDRCASTMRLETQESIFHKN